MLNLSRIIPIIPCFDYLIPKLLNGADMSDEPQDANNEDKLVDAISAVAIVVIPVIAVIYWLSGMPTS